MNKFAVLALLGVVNACPFENMRHMSHKPLCGMLEPAKHCPATDAKVFLPHEALRELLKALHMGFVKGMYQENHDIISDECFGEWTEPTYTAIHNLKKKAHEDFWTISKDDVLST